MWRAQRPNKTLTNIEKGKSFEREVAEYLRKELGYTETSLNERVKTNKETRPWECDIHGKRYSFSWDKLDRLAYTCILFFFLLLLANLQTAAGIFLASGFISLGIARLGRRFDKSLHVLVECKNLKSTVKRDHVLKLAHTAKEFRNSKSVEWKPDVVLFFSASGFDKDAKHFASQNRIECYKKSGDKFERVN